VELLEVVQLFQGFLFSNCCTSLLIRSIPVNFSSKMVSKNSKHFSPLFVQKVVSMGNNI
jgi:hypothetical protein